MPNTVLPKPTPPHLPTPGKVPQPVPPAPQTTPPAIPTTPTPTAATTPSPSVLSKSPTSPLPPSKLQPRQSQPIVSAPKTSQPLSTAPESLPPTTLTALSSMSSPQVPNTTLPQTDKKTAKNPQPNQKNSVTDTIKVVADKTKKSSVPTAKLANLKKSPLRFLPFILLVLLVAGAIFWAFKFFSGSKSISVTPPTSSGTNAKPGSGGNGGAPVAGGETVTLEYWGLWEPAAVMKQVLADFEKQNSGISVRYTKQSYRDYRQRLQTAIASGNGPDLFRFHATWTPTLSAELARMPASVYSAAEFQKIFYPVAATQLQINGQLVGIPLMYDGLALFYNKKALQTATADPPTTWSQLRTLAAKLTIKSGNDIKRGGVALGNASNVDHFSDIIALLMLQNGADLSQPNSAEGRDALLFYTNFQKSDGVWNSTLPSSTTAFARGEAAMIFAPSWRVHDIKAINPDLDFGIAPVPQLSDTRISWASYWAEGVSQKSSHQEAAWKLLKYLSSKPVQERLYSEQAGIRSFGEIYSRTDLADQVASNEMVRPFLQDAPFASGWYLSSMTHDAGINDQMIDYYKNAITGLLDNKPMSKTLSQLEQGTKQVLQQYSVK